MRLEPACMKMLLRQRVVRGKLDGSHYLGKESLDRERDGRT